MLQRARRLLQSVPGGMPSSSAPGFGPGGMPRASAGPSSGANMVQQGEGPAGQAYGAGRFNTDTRGTKYNNMGLPGEMGGSRLGSTGGLPFYGNMYQGRVNPDDFRPPPETNGTRPSVLFTAPRKYADDDPVVRGQMDRCPYFALCDMVVWHQMEPSFLDPGLLTKEEHHLLLMFSRAYYEKWKAIHSRTREIAPNIRIKKGAVSTTEDMLRRVGVSVGVQKQVFEALFDDSHLAGLHPRLWKACHMPDKLRDHLTGASLLAAGVKASQLEQLTDMVERMRVLVVHRRDRLTETSSDAERQFVPFTDCATLYDFYRLYGLEPYNGQLKVYNFFDEHGSRLSLTLSEEDMFFDMKFRSFYNANFDLNDANSLSRFVITVDPKTRAQTSMGRWI